MLESCLESLVEAIRRNICLNVVRREEHLAPTRSHDLDSSLYVLFDLVQAGKRQHLLDVDPTSPETEILAKLLFHLGDVHLGGASLD